MLSVLVIIDKVRLLVEVLLTSVLLVHVPFLVVVVLVVVELDALAGGLEHLDDTHGGIYNVANLA